MKAVFGILLIVLGTAYGQEDGGCPPTGMTPYDYSQALCMSSLFYEAQRSGVLPDDQRVTWREDSGLQDGADVSLDLTGGYYDAGDYVKFNFPQAFSITALGFGLRSYPLGMAAAGQTEYVKATMKWGTDYILKCATGETELWGQVGEPDADHDYWGRPEDMNETRISYKIDETAPGTDLAAETAAALAATAIVFSDSTSYANECLSVAQDMYAFANEYTDLYQNSIDAADGFYTSSGYYDEQAWAAIWLYLATGAETYLTDAKAFIDDYNLLGTVNGSALDWNDKTAAVVALMAEVDGGPEYISALEGYVDNLLATEHTPGGLVFISEWGSLRMAMNGAFIAMRASTLGINPTTYLNWAQSQVDYALGSVGHSFVCGFGIDPPGYPHHRSSSCPVAPEPCGWPDYNSLDPNPQTLYGGLVGGPNVNGNWNDSRADYVHNEVALDYNALFTGLLAAMVEVNGVIN